MRIQELLEAVPVGSSTQPPATTTQTPPAAPGQTPPAPTPQTPPTPTTQTPPAAPGQTPAPTLGNQIPTGQPMGQQPAIQQGMKNTMSDLDKIAAQIVGLKQKQQQMQQQMQTPVK